jgi:hypothetical protein
VSFWRRNSSQTARALKRLSLICELNQRLIYTWTEARHSGRVIRIYVDRLPGAEGESRVLAPSKVASCLLLGGCGGLRFIRATALLYGTAAVTRTNTYRALVIGAA